MVEPEVIDLSSEEEEDDVEIIEFAKETQNLIDNPLPSQQSNTRKSLANMRCPICFDELDKATVACCGHIFCLECILQSLASSTARGQTKGTKGVGLCPLCRKKVNLKDTVVLRLKNSSLKDIPSPETHGENT